MTRGEKTDKHKEKKKGKKKKKLGKITAQLSSQNNLFCKTVNSTTILYCCLYHFLRKLKKGKNKKKNNNVCCFKRVFLVPLQFWFSNTVYDIRSLADHLVI